MAITIGNITGSAQTGFTSPAYTVVQDTAPVSTGKQVYVSALGGTQAGVQLHSVSSPFTCTVMRPQNLQTLPAPDRNGLIRRVPMNSYKVLTRKGVVPAVNQTAVVMPIETQIRVPAGADSYDIANVRAALSAHIGLLTQISAGLGDTCATGTL